MLRPESKITIAHSVRDFVQYDYAFDAVLDGQDLGIDPDLPQPLRIILKGMLLRDPESRLSMEQVYGAFTEMDPMSQKKVEESTDIGTDTKHQRVDKWFYRP